MEIFGQYSFQVVALACVFLSIAAALVGNINFYKGQGLVGDALGHASFPGMLFAYILFGSMQSWYLLLGAIVSGGLAYWLVHLSHKYSKTDLNASLAIHLSGFFALGMVLKSYLQNQPDSSQQNLSIIGHYLFGQAAYLMEEDLKIMAIFCLLTVIVILVFYKQFKICLFDPVYAQVVGLPIKRLDYLQLLLTVIMIGIGIKAVGIVLISSFMLLPGLSARQWTDHFSQSLWLSVGFAICASLIGSYLSMCVPRLSTGPTMILALGFIAAISILFRWLHDRKALKQRRG